MDKRKFYFTGAYLMSRRGGIEQVHGDYPKASADARREILESARFFYRLGREDKAADLRGVVQEF